MARTELFEMSREERMEKISEMSTDLLFAELDDTIQFDILKIGNDEWTIGRQADKKVYSLIIAELKKRVSRNAGRKKLDGFDYADYLQQKELGIENEILAACYGISVATLYRRVKEEREKRGQEERLHDNFTE